MTTVVLSKVNEMATQSTFSYAQAAKGQNATPSDAGVAPAQDAEAPTADVEAPTPTAEQTTSIEVLETTDSNEVPLVASEKRDLESAAPSESDNRSETTQERRSEPRRDDDAGRLDRPWRRNEKAPRSSSTTTRSADEQDSRKPRRGKKGKSAEKQTGEQSTEKEREAVPEPPKIELSEAPIPSVNIWHQRKEAHAAKGGKPTDPVNGVSIQQDDNKSTIKVDGPTPAPHTNGVKAQQKTASTARPERSAPRGSRSADKDGKTGAPPSVEDSSSWPTPETVIQEDKKKTVEKPVEKPVDRADRSDKDSQEDGSSGKPRQKWVTYDYVPTVSFETQLPQMRGSKPRGGARSGREGAARPAANGVPEKTATTPVSKVSDSKPRETLSSASSQPSAAKRGPTDGGNAQKKASANSSADKAKDTTTQSNDNTQAPRERPEGRSERGRGGYRGRGAHHVNAQAQHQHSAQGAGFNGQGAAGSRGQGHYSPPLRQGAHGNMFVPANQRGRGGRNGSGNYHRMSLPNGTSRMPAAVQTQFAPYDYSMAVPAMPYQPQQPYWDNVVLTMLRSQIEYYFSIENLCKDMFLRSRMDSQGFVPLHFIAAFKRMRDLSGDMTLIRAVCEESIEVDFVVGEDDCERLRRRQDWQKFVLPMQDRDELARNDGPAHVTFKNRDYGYVNGQFNGVPPMAYPSHGYPMNPNDPLFQQYAEIPQAGHGVNGVANSNGTSQLSAEVPDFSPTGSLPVPGLGASTELANGHVEAPLTNGVHAEEAQATQS